MSCHVKLNDRTVASSFFFSLTLSCPRRNKGHEEDQPSQKTKPWGCGWVELQYIRAASSADKLTAKGGNRAFCLPSTNPDTAVPTGSSHTARLCPYSSEQECGDWYKPYVMAAGLIWNHCNLHYNNNTVIIVQIPVSFCKLQCCYEVNLRKWNYQKHFPVAMLCFCNFLHCCNLLVTYHSCTTVV